MKTQIQNQEVKKKRKALFSKTGLIVISLLVLVGTGLFFLFRNDSIVSFDKSSVSRNVYQIVNNIPMYGRETASILIDNGCGSVDPKILGARTINCTYVAKKYFTAQGKTNANDYLNKTINAIEKEGFTSKSYQWYTQTLGSEPISLRFTSGKADLTLNFSFSNPQLPDEFMYGIDVVSTYWTCTEGGINVKLPCPQPPGQIK